MKTLLFTLSLLTTQMVFSQQVTRIAFKMVGETAEVASGDLTKIVLPVQFSFPKANFDGKTLAIKKAGSTTEIASFVFGKAKGNITNGGGETDFIFRIEKDKTTNPPGANKIDGEKIDLFVNNQSFPVQFIAAPLNGGGTTTPETPKPGDQPGTVNQVEEYIPGFTYYDAMMIARMKKTDPELVKTILKEYGIIDEATFLANPYLKNTLGVGYYKDHKDIQGGKAFSMLSNLGNTDVTYFAEGLARFLAERTKEELNTAFFDKMKQQLIAYPELKTIFPKTASFIDLIDNYSYASVLQVLKEAFQTDMQNLPDNLYDLKDLSKINCGTITDKDKKEACEKRMDLLQEFFKSQTGLWVSLGMRTLKESTTASNPAELLNAVATSPDLQAIQTWAGPKNKHIDYNGASSIELANFLSANLLSKDEGEVWIDGYELQKLVTDKALALKIYMGLLYANQESDSIRFMIKGDTEPRSLRYLLDGIEKKYEAYADEIASLVKNAHNAYQVANNAIEKIRTATENSMEADMQSLYNYYQTFIASAKPIAQSKFLEQITGYEDLAANFDSIERYLSPAIDLTYHISVKQYSSAIYDAVVLLNQSNIKAMDEKTSKAFVKYGTLISSVASAQSSDEVKTALEASMLPTGSSSIKRNSRFNIAVNAYVGGYWGMAYSKDQDSLHPSERYQTYGLYAPIGVSFTHGLRWSKKKFGSITGTVQILDLGALVNFYLLKGDQTALPDEFKVRLSNVFAPGVQFGYNIPKTPLTVSWGGQFVPALYQTSQIASETEITATRAVRWNISLVVDLPLLNIATWDYRK